MKNRLPMIAFLAGALFAQVYALQADIERERRLRERDARDAGAVLERARDDLAAAGDITTAHVDLLNELRAAADVGIETVYEVVQAAVGTTE